jgi:hypothetical protein
MRQQNLQQCFGFLHPVRRPSWMGGINQFQNVIGMPKATDPVVHALTAYLQRLGNLDNRFAAVMLQHGKHASIQMSIVRSLKQIQHASPLASRQS